MEIKFTIAVPAYKTEFLREALQSCLVQTCRDFEVIVLDDHSPEDVKGIVDSFRDSRVRYYRNEVNVGARDLVKNWNRCLELACGKFFICMGDDDVLLPDCLSLYDALHSKHTDATVMHMATEKIDEYGHVIGRQEERPETESMWEMVWKRWNGRNMQYVGDFCYDTESLRANGGFVDFPLAWGSDDCTAAMQSYPSGIANCNVVGFQYRESSITISNSGRWREKAEASLQEKKWYSSRLLELSDGTDPYYAKVKDCIEGHFIEKVLYLYKLDRPLSVAGIISWWNLCKKFNAGVAAFSLRTLKNLIAR